MEERENVEGVKAAERPPFLMRKVEYADRDPANLAAYGYHYDLRVLTAVFKRGKAQEGVHPLAGRVDVYHYFDAPSGFFDTLERADSKGSAFQNHVKPYFADPATYTKEQYLSTGRLVRLCLDARLALTVPLVSVSLEGEEQMADLAESLHQLRNASALVLPQGARLERVEPNELMRSLAEVVATLRFKSWRAVVSTGGEWDERGDAEVLPEWTDERR